jgi:hypothetical protein
MATLPCEDGAGSLNNPNAPSTQLGTNNPALKPYVAPDLQIGEWQISSLNPDECARNDHLRQETYVAEAINVAGAPLNIFKLLGVHEQGNGSQIKLTHVQEIASTTWVIPHTLGDTLSVKVTSAGATVVPTDVESNPFTTTLTFAVPTAGTAELIARNLISSAPAPGFPTANINTTGVTWKSLQTGSAAVQSYVGVDFGIKVLSNARPQYEPQKPKFSLIGSISITQADNANEFAKQVKVDITDGTVTLGDITRSRTSGPLPNGLISSISLGSDALQGMLMLQATAANYFEVFFTPQGSALQSIGLLEVGEDFNSTIINLKLEQGSTPFQADDTIFIPISYSWKRAGIFNLIQSPEPQVLNLNTPLHVKAIKISPTLFTGSGSWSVSAIDFFSYSKTDINNIQDLFFGENRDRDYDKTPLLIKAQYTPTDAITDLSKFGLSILDQYSFTAAFSTIVKALGRPIVVGDIIEVIPELQYDQNLKPIRKFLEVTDTSWAAEGFSTQWKPTLMRFVAQQALPSQETRDIFGTIDTQKYLVADSILADGLGEQIDATALTQLEELRKETQNKVPEIGSDDDVSSGGSPIPTPQPPRNPRGQPDAVTPTTKKQGVYTEDGLPPNGEPYLEGFKLPDIVTAGITDGDYFRLYYPPETKIPPRLYRYSGLKNRWIYQETDRRGEYSSYKPTVRSILQSDNKQPLKSKKVL